MKAYSSFELIKILKAHGWYFYKANGSHHHYKHPIENNKVTIPHPKKNIPSKTVISILKQAKIKP